MEDGKNTPMRATVPLCSVVYAPPRLRPASHVSCGRFLGFGALTHWKTLVHDYVVSREVVGIQA
jgi:hypothetical protein